MTSTTSSVKLPLPGPQAVAQLYRWTLGQNKGLALLYAALWLILSPLVLLLSLSGVSETQRNYQEQINEIFHSCMLTAYTFAGVPLLLLLAFVLGLLLFSFQQKRRSVDLFHALPVTRSALFLGRYLAGLTILLVPPTAASLLAEAVRLAYGVPAALERSYSSYLSMSLQDGYLPLILLMATAAYTCTVFFSVCSGTVFDAAASLVVVSVTWPLATVLSRTAAGMILPGVDLFSGFGLVTLFDTLLSPFFGGLLATTLFRADPAFCIWWAFFTAAVFAASLLLYRRRKSESAESQFAFPVPKAAVRFLASFAAALCMGMIFLYLSNGNYTVYFLTGALIGSLCTHIIAEGVYSRGFKGLWKSLRFYGLFAAVFAACYVSVSFGFFGVDTYLPAAENIARVEVDLPYRSNNNNTGFTVFSITPAPQDGAADGPSSAAAMESQSLTSVQPVVEDAALVRELHEALIALEREEHYPYQIDPYRSNDITLRYYLEDGSIVYRGYESDGRGTLETREKVAGLMNEILQRDEFRLKPDPIFYLDADAILSIGVQSFSTSSNQGGGYYDFTLTEAQQERLLAALQSDVRNHSGSYAVDGESGRIWFQGNNEEWSYGLSLSVMPFVPDNEALLELTGGYRGRVDLTGNFNYDLSESLFPETTALLGELLEDAEPAA